MTITIMLEREKPGNRHSPLLVKDGYSVPDSDDADLRNCGVEFYSAWVGMLDSIHVKNFKCSHDGEQAAVASNADKSPKGTPS